MFVKACDRIHFAEKRLPHYKYLPFLLGNQHQVNKSPSATYRALLQPGAVVEIAAS